MQKMNLEVKIIFKTGDGNRAGIGATLGGLWSR